MGVRAIKPGGGAFRQCDQQANGEGTVDEQRRLPADQASGQSRISQGKIEATAWRRCEVTAAPRLRQHEGLNLG